MGFFPVSPLPATIPGPLTITSGPVSVTSGNMSLGLGSFQAPLGGVSCFGPVDVTSAGQGFQVKEGANAKQGTFVLTGVTSQAVPNTSVTANSRIFLCEQLAGGTPGLIGVASRIAGTSFTVSCVATDTSTYAYEIFEPG